MILHAYNLIFYLGRTYNFTNLEPMNLPFRNFDILSASNLLPPQDFTSLELEILPPRTYDFTSLDFTTTNLTFYLART